jgi:hypothetical protein
MPKKSAAAFRDAIKGAASGTTSSSRPRTPGPAQRGRVGSRKDTRPHRVSRVNVTGYFDPAVKKSFHLIQAEHPELTVQELLEEAINDLFAKYHVPETARLHKEKGVDASDGE